VFCVTPALLAALEDVRVERGDCSLTDGVRKLAERGRARVADIPGGFWQDVDTPEDRAHAERMLDAFGRDLK
jgi:dTDP-glucose pyrophosphorylase